MYTVDFKFEGKKQKAENDAKNEREAKLMFERSLAKAEVDWSTFTNTEPRPLVVTKKKAEPEKTADVHL